MRNLLRNIRLSTRLLSRSPGFALAAIATLALGIGANTAIFSLAETVLLRPLKVAEPARLVVWPWSSSYPDFLEYMKRTDVLSGAMASSGSRVSISVDGRSELRRTLFVSGNAFGVLGVPAAHGRTLVQPDDVPNAPIVAMMSHAYWTTRFGQDRGVIGRVIQVNGRPATIIGVTSAEFRGVSLFSNPDLYLPLTSYPRVSTGGFLSRVDVLAARGFVWLTVVARLKEGVTADQASRAMEIFYGELHPRAPGEPLNKLEFVPMPTRALGSGAASVRRFVVLLAGVVTLTMLIGCANLANLMLARGAARRREVGVRLAMGATRGAILEQMLVESLVIAVLGGAAGLLVAVVGLQLLGRFELPGGIPIGNLGLQLNASALAVAGALSIATGLLFGAAPAWRASRGDVLLALHDSSRGASSRSRLRSALVAAEVALSVVLLAGSGLFLRSLAHALNVPLGFDADGAATASVNLGLARFDEARTRDYYAAALERVQSLPGVVSAGWAAVVPTVGLMNVEMSVAGYQKAPAEPMTFYVGKGGPGYFSAAGTRIVHGRSFTPADDAAAPLVAIVNEHAAQKYWAGRALGGRIKVDSEKSAWATVVGVAENTKVRQIGEKPVPQIYFPFDQSFDDRGFFQDAAHLFVRTSGSVDDLLPLLAEQLRAVDPAAPIYDVQPFAEHVRGLVMPQRMGVTLFGFFSLLALSLATIGIYGVASYVAALRTREIGIRMALGANGRTIGRLIVGQGLVPAAAGVAAGAVLAVWAGRLARGFLYDISPADPLTLGGVSLLLALVAMAAIHAPARRAANMNPVTALRHE